MPHYSPGLDGRLLPAVIASTIPLVVCGVGKPAGSSRTRLELPCSQATSTHTSHMGTSTQLTCQEHDYIEHCWPRNACKCCGGRRCVDTALVSSDSGRLRTWAIAKRSLATTRGVKGWSPTQQERCPVAVVPDRGRSIDARTWRCLYSCGADRKRCCAARVI